VQNLLEKSAKLHVKKAVAKNNVAIVKCKERSDKRKYKKRKIQSIKKKKEYVKRKFKSAKNSKI
jgi:hypothetical protein